MFYFFTNFGLGLGYFRHYFWAWARLGGLCAHGSGVSMMKQFNDKKLFVPNETTCVTVLAVSSLLSFLIGASKTNRI